MSSAQFWSWNKSWMVIQPVDWELWYTDTCARLQHYFVCWPVWGFICFDFCTQKTRGLWDIQCGIAERCLLGSWSNTCTTTIRIFETFSLCSAEEIWCQHCQPWDDDAEKLLGSNSRFWQLMWSPFGLLHQLIHGDPFIPTKVSHSFGKLCVLFIEKVLKE